MINFGYSISPSSRIDLDKRDNDKFTRIVLLESGFRKCMACGLCTATCSGGNFADVSLRRAIEMMQDGQEISALVLLKGCMLCGKCNIICPRGINTRNLIRNILKVYKEELQ